MTYDKWKTTEPDQHEECFPPDEITDEREELYAEIERLREYNAKLLAAAKEAMTFVFKREILADEARAYLALEAAIAAAEKPAP